MPDTITEAQARRFWAIALDTGYNRPGVQRLLNGFGYDEAEKIKPEDYEEMCRIAQDGEAAFKYNRDPDTQDMFNAKVFQNRLNTE